jgi:hypothetical protein
MEVVFVLTSASHELLPIFEFGSSSAVESLVSGSQQWQSGQIGNENRSFGIFFSRNLPSPAHL